MAGKQSAAMDKAEKMWKDGARDVSVIAFKSKVDPSSIYRSSWFKKAKLAAKEK